MPAIAAGRATVPNNQKPGNTQLDRPSGRSEFGGVATPAINCTAPANPLSATSDSTMMKVRRCGQMELAVARRGLDTNTDSIRSPHVDHIRCDGGEIGKKVTSGGLRYGLSRRQA